MDLFFERKLAHRGSLLLYLKHSSRLRVMPFIGTTPGLCKEKSPEIYNDNQG